MKVEGHRVKVQLGRGALRPIDVGDYALIEGSAVNAVTSPIECPYCHVPLFEVSSDVPFARIVLVVERDGDKGEAIVQSLPSTHQLLTCEGCDVEFVTLKEE